METCKCGHPLAIIKGVKRCLYCNWSEVPEPYQAMHFRQTILDNNKKFVEECHEALMQNRDGALTYLKYRGIQRESIEKWELGYVAPGQGIPNFWGRPENWEKRILFPIWDAGGKNIIAGGARKITVDDRSKYVNSAASAEYDKSRNLYGSWMLPKGSPKVFLCEGYMDVISLSDKFGLTVVRKGNSSVYGATYAVAPLGTALTDAQAHLLYQRAESIVLCFDSDEPGQAATRRAVDVLHKAGFSPDKISVLVIEGAKDIDECLNKCCTIKEYALLDWLVNHQDYATMARLLIG